MIHEAARRTFEHRHVICFEETNVVGNVYFARHVAWQGACREMFLRQHAPDVLDEIAKDLRLITLSVSCDYFQELHAFDEVRLGMSLAGLHGGRIALEFDYQVRREDRWEQCALGKQRLACMRYRRDRLEPCDPPEPLRRALSAFGGPTLATGTRT